MQKLKRAQAIKLGVDKYYTGKLCKRGHLSERYTCNTKCIICSNEYYLKNRDEILKFAVEYRNKNKTSINEKWRERYKNSPEKHKINSKRYVENNRGLVIEQRKIHYLKNKHWVMDRKNKWRKNNPDHVKLKSKQYSVKRRADKAGADGYFSDGDIKRLLAAQRGLCNNCKIDVSKYYHVDHIMPLSRGGSNWPRNLQILCESCNCRKHNKLPIEWRLMNEHNAEGTNI